MITVIFNTVNRPQMVAGLMVNNILNSGVDKMKVIVTNNGGGAKTSNAIKKFTERVQSVAEVTCIERASNIGNPQSLNIMLKSIEDSTHIAILGDDIEMPLNWAKTAIDKCDGIHICGLLGFNWRPDSARGVYSFTYKLYVPNKVFGCWVLSYKTFEEAGYLLEMSKYGLWDSEYNDRLASMGRINGYIPDNKCIHLGTDGAEVTKYRLMKNAELAKASALFSKVVKDRPIPVTWEDRQYWLKDK